MFYTKLLWNIIFHRDCYENARLFANKVKIKLQPPLYRTKFENFEDDVRDGSL